MPGLAGPRRGFHVDLARGRYGRKEAGARLERIDRRSEAFGGQSRFAGQVVTVRCFEDNTLVKPELDRPGLGRVLVVDGGASLRRALVGGNLGAAASRNGWAGVLVNGCVRDVAEMQVLP